MKRLSPVPVPPAYIDIFEEIRDYKKGVAKAALVGEQTAIRDRFTDYNARFAANTLQGLPTSTLTGIRKELRSCYGRNKVMEILKKAIAAAQPKGRLSWCPYCGATTPGSHDHYVPAHEFPEFAAHALNLVPCCTRCNSIKDDDWLHAGARQYLHFYLDPIPAVPFLSVTLTSNAAARAVGATFSFGRAGMPAAAWTLLDAHFRKLGLVKLYDTYSNDLINTTLRSARSYIRSGGPSAADFLANEALENGDLYGESGWRAVLLRAMSVHPDLDQWVAWL